jgi:hypothetical protein
VVVVVISFLMACGKLLTREEPLDGNLWRQEEFATAAPLVMKNLINQQEPVSVRVQKSNLLLGHSTPPLSTTTPTLCRLLSLPSIHVARSFPSPAHSHFSLNNAATRTTKTTTTREDENHKTKISQGKKKKQRKKPNNEK